MPWSSYQVIIILPTSAVSGQRIVLDGNTGLIGIYDANDNLVATMAAKDSVIGNVVSWLHGVTVYSATSKTSIQMSEGGTISFNAYPDQSQYTQSGQILANNPAVVGAGPLASLQFQTPTTDPNKQSLITAMYSSATNSTGNPYLFVGGFKGSNNTGLRGDIQVAGFVLPQRASGSSWVSENWTSPTFDNGWASDTVGVRAQPVVFHMRPDGWVSMRGVAAGGTNTALTRVAFVPMYYAPQQTEWFVVPCVSAATTFVTLRITPAGDVLIETPGANPSIGFGGVSWATGAVV